MKTNHLPQDVLEFFRRSGAHGRKTRAARYSQERLQQLGRLGGRPKESGNSIGRKENA